jgi:hypothetical protein
MEAISHWPTLFNALPPVYILLGPPGRAQVFPYLSPNPLDFLVVCKNE